MRKHVIETVNSNLFYVSLLCFVAVLPFSQALVSIFASIIPAVALLEDSWKNKITRFKKNKILLFIPAIYLVYIISSITSWNQGAALYDLNKSLFFLLIPLGFMLGKEITSKQKRILFQFFTFAVVLSTFVALINWKFSTSTANFSIHKASMVSHIRFSFQLILAFWFLIIFTQKNGRNLKPKLSVFLLLTSLYILFFLVLQQSLTGIIAFISSVLFYLFYLAIKSRPAIRMASLVSFILVLALPCLYLYNSIRDFYDFERIDPDTIERTTNSGNPYSHNFNDKSVENGHYVELYVCMEEMREEWNRLSEVKYDSLTTNGFPLHATLHRYLTSKGFRKDAEGVKALSPEDVRNVENGVANVIFAGNKYSIYPRIYQTIWEYHEYSHSGNANNKSFAQRIEYTKAALSIIRQNLFFGVGTGRWQQAFQTEFERSEGRIDQEFRASSHNQYLNYLVKFGMVGFFIIFCCLSAPLLIRKLYKDPLFMIFLVFLSFANLADSNFESHMGSSFFVFFYCIFMIRDSWWQRENTAKSGVESF